MLTNSLNFLRWRFLVAQNYYPMPAKVWIGSGNEIFNVDNTAIARYRKDIHYNREKEYLKNPLIIKIFVSSYQAQNPTHAIL